MPCPLTLKAQKKLTRSKMNTMKTQAKGKLPGEPHPAGRSPHSPCTTAHCNSKILAASTLTGQWTNSLIPAIIIVSIIVKCRFHTVMLYSHIYAVYHHRTYEMSAYVAACARTRTPPAQRLDLRGESDAIVYHLSS